MWLGRLCQVVVRSHDLSAKPTGVLVPQGSGADSCILGCLIMASVLIRRRVKR